MPYTTMGFDVFHSGPPDLNDKLRAGNTLLAKLLSVHMLQAYADTRAAAGQGAIWKISLPYLIWSRGFAVGAIQHSPTCPGTSFTIDDSFLVRNYNQIRLQRV